MYSTHLYLDRDEWQRIKARAIARGFVKGRGQANLTQFFTWLARQELLAGDAQDPASNGGDS